MPWWYDSTSPNMCPGRDNNRSLYRPSRCTSSHHQIPYQPSIGPQCRQSSNHHPNTRGTSELAAAQLSKPFRILEVWWASSSQQRYASRLLFLLQVQTRTVLFFHLFSDILVVRLVNRLDTPTNGSLSLASNGDQPSYGSHLDRALATWRPAHSPQHDGSTNLSAGRM